MSHAKIQLRLKDLAHLCSVLRGAALKWIDIGLQVGVHVDDLDVIRSNPLVIHEGVRGFLREMLRRWLKDATQPTLDDVIAALRQDSVGEERLANELKDEFLKLREAATLKAEAEAKETALAEEEAASPATKKPKLCSSPEGTEGSERDTCTQLDLEELIDVSTYLLTLNQDQVFGLGLALGLSVATLNPIKNSPMFLDDMLTAWLLGKDAVKRRGGHTWRSLVNGLRHKRVNQTEIADKVEQEMCQC